MSFGEPVVSALFAGGLAILVTLAVERLGGLLGGFLATLPTTIVPAAVGIAGSTGGARAFAEAMYATAPGMLLNALFLWLWQVLPPRVQAAPPRARLPLVLCGSLGCWALGAICLRGWLVRVALPLEAAIACVCLTALLGFWAMHRVPPLPPVRRRVGRWVLLSRGIAAAIAVGLAVTLSRRGDTALAGLASVFPAIFLTTMVSLWSAHGAGLPAGAVGPMMVGSCSVSSFALFAAEFFPRFDVRIACVLSWIGAVALVQAPLFVLARRRQSASPPEGARSGRDPRVVRPGPAR